eukprot:TRINITY_DN11263_c0_g1_i1.p1 TRINITY_DN11263_c0_g1~~TRINITY_DN11263_c0_g1_i1.p1  ORF type:complete len:363 (+),score=101.27 TRINITY_DN11263_c0_g1_i1:122-1090(+)
MAPQGEGEAAGSAAEAQPAPLPASAALVPEVVRALCAAIRDNPVAAGRQLVGAAGQIEADLAAGRYTPDDLRGDLKTLLTVLTFDPPEAVMGLIDRLLQQELSERQVTQVADLFGGPAAGEPPERTAVAVWRGDITLLACDAIVNACNDRMLGCMRPHHPCIDNAIHCRAGPRLRKACREFMVGVDAEPTGQCRVTDAYCLPCRHVLHTVGPIVQRRGPEQPELLASCYRTCLDAARRTSCRSVAFCCLSTGVFGYPARPACGVALRTVADWARENADYAMRVIFNVFKREDLQLYAEQTPVVFGPGVPVVDSLGDYDPPST